MSLELGCRTVGLMGLKHISYVGFSIEDRLQFFLSKIQKDGIFQYEDTVAGKGILATYYWPKNGRNNVNYQPGRIKIIDANKDSAFSPADRIVLGSHNPNFIGSITNTFTYKNF